MREALPRLSVTGCLLLTAAPVAVILSIAGAVLTCSEGGDCPTWSRGALVAPLFVTSVVFIALVLLYGLIQPILGRPRIHPVIVVLLVLLGLYVLLVAGERFILAR